MKKNYIKMNNNDNHLSLGNLFRIIKDMSKNKISAFQTELFCVLFNIVDINDTTVNNYCVGCRSIGDEYKQIYLNKEKKYQKEENEFCDTIINILNIIDGTIYIVKDNKIDFINQSNSAIVLTKKLYNICKNDKSILSELKNKIRDLIHAQEYYKALVEILIFTVIHKKQPLYETDLKKEVIETVLNDTSISSTNLEEYLQLKLREGINYDHSLITMAQNGNAYANFEMGTNEYYGYFKGYPRYDKAYEYFLSSAEYNHVSANYMLGNMLIKGLIGSKSQEELEKGYEYLLKAMELGNVAACNVIGNMYYEGIHPLKKDLKKAIEYYKMASEKNYAYAFNNLGRIYEKNKEYEKAYENYLIAANLGESWACNKVGEYLRQGIITKDMKLAFYYFNKALENNYRTTCYYAYYNLAKYYYQNGYLDIVNKSDIHKTINYFQIASEHNIFEAKLELLYIYIKKYLEEKEENIYQKIIQQKELIENSEEYNDEIRLEIEKELHNISKCKINIDIIN